MDHGFDRLAPYYDPLTRLVFGKAMIDSQVQFLSLVRSGSKVLVVGGGTGKILKKLSAIPGIAITYVDASVEMINRAKDQIDNSECTTFYHTTINDFSINGQFDYIITPFFLDLFNELSLKLVMIKLHGYLKEDGLWLFTDFRLGSGLRKLWQLPLLMLMLIFFRLSCSIEASALQEFDKYFRQLGYSLDKEKLFYGEFIVGSVYVKGKTLVKTGKARSESVHSLWVK